MAAGKASKMGTVSALPMGWPLTKEANHSLICDASRRDLTLALLPDLRPLQPRVTMPGQNPVTAYSRTDQKRTPS